MKNSNDIESIFDEVLIPTINRCGIKKNSDFKEDDSQIGDRVYAVQFQDILNGVSIGLKQIVYRIVQRDLHVTFTDVDFEFLGLHYDEESFFYDPGRQDLILYYKTINEDDIFSHLNWLVGNYVSMQQLVKNWKEPDFTPSYFKSNKVT